LSGRHHDPGLRDRRSGLCDLYESPSLLHDGTARGVVQAPGRGVVHWKRDLLQQRLLQQRMLCNRLGVLSDWHRPLETQLLLPDRQVPHLRDDLRGLGEGCSSSVSRRP
jgi:hypothetical protein